MEINRHVIRGALAKHRIEVLDMTQKELAAKVGVNSMMISLIERGYWHLRRKDRQRFADVYGLPLEVYEEIVRGARESVKGETS
jgi:transcriptional regulator with XRE-family HTH domain